MSDERFKALKSDPRYRLPSRKEARTTVDPRFQRLFHDQDFRRKAKVDRYGRKINADAGKKELERLYRLDTSAEEATKKKSAVSKQVVNSLDENEEDEESGNEDGVEDEDGAEAKRRFDPARNGGFSESSSEEDSSEEDSESELEHALADETAGQEQTEAIPMGDISKRLACVNLDWDHIRASDILAVASSFAPSSGRVERVTVYPSEFGRERLEMEEIEGPPREIFASSSRIQEEESEVSSDDDDDEKIKNRLLAEQADEGNEFDTGKLRKYQLERLRYYYAVIECDSKTTGKTLYDSMDGREYLTSANFFDLRFIPDGVTFDDDQPRDECSTLPEGYKPNEFTTEALTHSKVRLTWDDDDTTRKEVQKRAFSRAEMDENDLQAYIGSDSSDAESISSRKSSAADRKAQKKDAERAKMRAALGLAAESAKSRRSKDEPVGDMQITFTSGLGGGKEGESVFENEPQDEESTRARYIRKERERKQMRKEKMRAAKHGAKNGEQEIEEQVKPDHSVDQQQSDDDDPFNDPFFNDPKASAVQEKKAKQAEKQKRRDAKAAVEAEAESRRAELELLMAGDADENGMRHFDMREIEKAEKDAQKKGKKGKGKKNDKQKPTSAPVDDFTVQTEDPRFKALFESHEFAIDPTNPRFKGTKGMKALLEEGRKKRKRNGDEDHFDTERKKSNVNEVDQNGDRELSGLVARLKGAKGQKKA